MAQYGGKRFHIHAVLQRQRCEGVAQIMKSNMLASCVLQNELQSAAHYAGGDGAFLLHWGREHPARVHCFFVLTQHRHHRRRQDDLADGVLRLGRADLKLAPHIVDLFVHIQYASLEVQVVPLQRHELAPAQAGGQVQKEDFVVALELRLDEKPLKLLPRQYLHLPCLLRRQLAADGRVDTDQSILHRLLQCRAAGSVTHTHHPVGQPFAVLVGEALPATIFDPTASHSSRIKGVYFNPKWCKAADDRMSYWELELADLCAYPRHLYSASASPVIVCRFNSLPNVFV